MASLFLSTVMADKKWTNCFCLICLLIVLFFTLKKVYETFLSFGHSRMERFTLWAVKYLSTNINSANERQLFCELLKLCSQTIQLNLIITNLISVDFIKFLYHIKWWSFYIYYWKQSNCNLDALFLPFLSYILRPNDRVIIW